MCPFREQQTLELRGPSPWQWVLTGCSCPAEAAAGPAVLSPRSRLVCPAGRDPFLSTVCRVNVDFQKQTVDPVQVSFSTTGGSQLVPDLFLTVDVTEVGVPRASGLHQSRHACHDVVLTP